MCICVCTCGVDIFDGCHRRVKKTSMKQKTVPVDANLPTDWENKPLQSVHVCRALTGNIRTYMVGRVLDAQARLCV